MAFDQGPTFALAEGGAPRAWGLDGYRLRAAEVALRWMGAGRCSCGPRWLSIEGG
jgi:hypothetical protein